MDGHGCDAPTIRRRTVYGGVPMTEETKTEALDDDRRDRDLTERIRRGNAAAFESLVSAHMRGAFSVAYRVLGNREDAEDLVQDAFIRLLERIDQFDARRRFRPWFYRIVVNLALNARRRGDVRATETLPPHVRATTSPPDEGAARAELRERLEAALAELPERQRTIVQLMELEGFSSAEVAEVVGLADGTVRWHLHQAREALRQALAPQYRTDEE